MTSLEKFAFMETILGIPVTLDTTGVFRINGIKCPWYRNDVTGKPWIPAKRRSFVSLVKTIIREDYPELVAGENTPTA